MGVVSVDFAVSDLYIAGDFVGSPTDTNVQFVAKLWGTNWVAVGNGLTMPPTVEYGGVYTNFGVRAITDVDNQIYIGGDFIAAGGHTNIQYLARLDGTNWSAVGGGVNGVVRALAVCAGNLFVGGDFTMAGGKAANGIAGWDGTKWT